MTPADAVPSTWVDAAPERWRPYLRLMRLDRPIGTWLLFWPSVFGLVMAAAAQQRAYFSQPRDVWLLAVFAIGAVVMRGAGCTYNDIVDRDIDGQVARTRGRPIPSGAVSVKQAWRFLLAQLIVGLCILLTLNWFAVALGASSLILIAIYPFMKRITWLPQAWLGLTFNWGALLGFAAVTQNLAPSAYVLYAGCFFWTLGYDTIYALQDMEDDALAGVKSTARLFGAHTPVWVALFYLAAVLLISIAGLAARPSWAFAAVMLVVTAHLLWQVRGLHVDDSAGALRIFRSNRDAGALIAAALLVTTWLG
ncbi:MAG TPA: 4-hydroxybenzoate octaprenyltransferase [Rhizomicrobium sp.]|nr:4-hydroxybenzoate octaprenyltransferase [Rhizomicrobium sp.]